MVKMDSQQAKKETTNLEVQHPLGRLWDMDIYRNSHEMVSRSELNLPPRRCYLCNNPAHSCGRSKKHDLQELEQYILDLYQSFQSRNSISELK
jgi:holo-ACP synthase